MERSTRSVESTEPVYLRFLNCTGREVLVFWLDYEGNKKLYRELGPGGATDINTFVTHPWQFEDTSNGDLLMLHFPSTRPALSHCRRVVPILLPVLSLTENCLRALRNSMSRPEHSFLLELPRFLQFKLYYLLCQKLCRSTHPQPCTLCAT